MMKRLLVILSLIGSVLADQSTFLVGRTGAPLFEYIDGENRLLYSTYPPTFKVECEWQFTIPDEGGPAHAFINGVDVCPAHAPSHIIEYDINAIEAQWRYHLERIDWEGGYVSWNKYWECKFTMAITGVDGQYVTFIPTLLKESFPANNKDSSMSMKLYVYGSYNSVTVTVHFYPDNGKAEIYDIR